MNLVVNVPACPIFKEPRPGSELADEALLGTAVEMLEQAGDYRKIRTQYRYEGFIHAKYLTSSEDWAGREKQVVFHKNFAPIFAAPDIRALRLATLPLGALVAAVEALGDWTAVELPDGRRGYTRSGWLAKHWQGPPELPEPALRARLAQTALRYQGAPYLWGGKTPQGIDCSGLVFMAYFLCGITVYRDAKLLPSFDLAEIDLTAKQPGDVLFFPGHVALYLGGGQYIHATGKAGDDGVTVNSLDPTAPDYRPDLAQSLRCVGSYRGFCR